MAEVKWGKPGRELETFISVQREARLFGESWHAVVTLSGIRGEMKSRKWRLQNNSRKENIQTNRIVFGRSVKRHIRERIFVAHVPGSDDLIKEQGKGEAVHWEDMITMKVALHTMSTLHTRKVL